MPSVFEQDQERIIQVAEYLQRQDGKVGESGLDPAYLMKAAEHVSRLRNVQRKRTDLLLALVPLLVSAQWLGMFSMMSDTLRSWAGLQWWLVLALCLGMGAVLSRTQRERNQACLLVL